MDKIVRFNSEAEFIAYRKSKTLRELGSGSEGTCYLGNDGLAYKDLTDGFRSELYVPEDIITTGEYRSKSFAFPHMLFAVDDELVGYATDVVKKDITNYKYIFFNGLDHIDFDKLYSAYQVMYDDAVELTEQGISIYDLPYNLMFDGERLIGVDTCGYYRAPVMDCLDNPSYVDEAVKRLFTNYAEYVKKESLDTSMDVLDFLQMVEKRYTSHGKKTGKTYIKH